MIASCMHHFGWSYKKALWKMSYRSLILLSSSVPGYEEEAPESLDEKMPIGEFIGASGGRVV